MNIRNFSIVAHIDHGKTTLCDRLLEARMRMKRVGRVDIPQEAFLAILRVGE